jgi:hypothetical protein
VLAAGSIRVSVIEPAAHTVHATVAVGLNWPAVHWEHDVAPAASSKLVVEPLGQSAHASVASVLHRPASHAVHVVPFAVASVSVVEPGLHVEHVCWPVASWYRPGLQPAQAMTEVSLLCPASHVVHAVAPVLRSELVTEPPAHAAHAVVGAGLY